VNSGIDARIDDLGQKWHSTSAFRFVGVELDDEVKTKKNLQIRVLMDRSVTGSIDDNFVIASLQVGKTKAPAIISLDLIDQAPAESFQTNWNTLRGATAVAEAHFTAHFEGQGIAGVSIAFPLGKHRGSHG